MIKSFRKNALRLWGLFISLMVLFFLIGCGNSGNESADGSNTTTTDLSSLNLTLSSSVASYGTAVNATATLRDTDGNLVSGAVVTFAATSGLVAFTPASATALTNSSGVATVSLDAASPSSTGATSITASALLSSGGSTSTITSSPVGVAVNGATLSLESMTLGSNTISSYGTSSVSVRVLVNHLLATVPIAVTFTSPCVSAGKATLSSPVTSIGGTAVSTYKDNNCATGTDLITASVTGASISTTIAVTLPATSNIQFVSATPSIIGTSTSSATTLQKSSVVKFRVVDSSNNGKSGVGVTFSILPSTAPGEITFTPSSATSDADGYVTTTVTSGTVPTPLWVVAAITSTPSIKSQSNTLTITTGLPAQNFFSLSASTHSIEGWIYDGIKSTLTIIASDRLGNPVPDGTAVNFITEGGHLSSGSCTTTGGVCSITFSSAEYRPIDETTTENPNGAVAAGYYDDAHIWHPIIIYNANGTNSGPLYVKNGRVTVLAYALGEKSFVDSNGNNSYDADQNETFYDLGDLYLDANENGRWDSNPSQPDLLEQYIHYAAGSLACKTQPAATDLPDNYDSSPSKENTCNGTWGLNYVRREQVIILSGSTPLITQYAFNIGGTCSGTFYFWLMDQNYNPMPAGTTLSTSNNAVSGIYLDSGGNPSSPKAQLSVGGTPVIDSTHAGGTLASLTVDGGDACRTAASIVQYPVGTLNLVTSTNTSGIAVTNSSIPVMVCNDPSLDNKCRPMP